MDKFKPLPAPHEAIRYRVSCYLWGFYITYVAPSLEALRDAGGITQPMLDSLLVSQKGIQRRYEDGDTYQRSMQGSSVRVRRYVRTMERDGVAVPSGHAKAKKLPGLDIHLRELVASCDQVAEQLKRSNLNVDPSWIQDAAISAARDMGKPEARIVERTRIIGRRRPAPVSWTTVGGLIVIPDWLRIKRAVEAARGANA